MPWRDILECGCLGDKLFGQDVDTLFAYQTARVAKIKDRSLGLIRIFLMLCIFIYIFIFNIWYKGAHFSFTPVSGVARLQWQEPTQDHCNPADVDCMSDFTDTTDLPYCRGYKGSSPDKVQQDCAYSDSRKLPRYIMDGVLMPTYIERYKQMKTCPLRSKSCDRKWKYAFEDGTLQTAKGTAKPVFNTFIADVGRYTLLIDHNFKTEKYWLAADDYNMKGYWVDCKKDEPENCVTNEIKCVHSRCKDLKFTSRASFLDTARDRYQSWIHPGRKYYRKNQGYQSQLWYDQDGGRRNPLAQVEAEDDDDEFQTIGFSAKQRAAATDTEPTAIAISNGDVLSLDTMLRMAGRTLDETWEDQKEGTQNVRLRGVALVINIQYQNLKPWTLLSPEDPPWYEISVTAMKSHKFKDIAVIREDTNSRDLQMAYGVYFVVKQTGHLAYLDPIYGLVAMTSAMALVAMSNQITDFLMLSVLPKKDEYYTEKYKESDDFNPDKLHQGGKLS